MHHVRGDETPEEIIVLAYGMEEGLRTFYTLLAEREGDPELKSALDRLAGFEEKHKARLFRLYQTFDASITDQETFESGPLPLVMEGGTTTEEFFEKNREALKSREDVLNITMMLETQALDLYLRFAHKVENEKSRAVLLGIADEEKGHLKILGRLF
ncbi:MAG: ferritin family protein, partial [Pseudomonadota bacterium]